METRYNLKSPGERGWGGWAAGRPGGGPGGPERRFGRLAYPRFSWLLRVRALREAAAGPGVQAAGRGGRCGAPDRLSPLGS